MEIPEVSAIPKPQVEKPRGRFWLWVVLFLVVIGVLAGVWWYKKYKLKTDTSVVVVPKTSVNEKIVLGVKRTEVDFSQIPEGIPLDYPAEESAKIVQNYIAVGDGGNKQAVREYETSKSQADNIKIYKDYFSRLKWQVTADMDVGNNTHVINAVKAKVYFTVSIGPSALTQKPTIKLLITQF